MNLPFRTLAIAAALAVAACAETTPIERPQTMTELKPTDRTYQLVQGRIEGAYHAMAAGDLERLLELYLPDALFQSAGQPPVAGAAAIRAFWLATFDKYRIEMVPHLDEATAFGDLVVVRGRTTGKLVPRNGDAAVPVDIWFQQIYRADTDGTLRFWRGANGPNP